MLITLSVIFGGFVSLSEIGRKIFPHDEEKRVDAVVKGEQPSAREDSRNSHGLGTSSGLASSGAMATIGELRAIRPQQGSFRSISAASASSQSLCHRRCHLQDVLPFKCGELHVKIQCLVSGIKPPDHTSTRRW